MTADPWEAYQSNRMLLARCIATLFFVTLAIEAVLYALLKVSGRLPVRWHRLLGAVLAGNIASYILIGGYVLSLPALTGDCQFVSDTAWVHATERRVWFVDPDSRQLSSIRLDGADRRLELSARLDRRECTWGPFSNYAFTQDCRLIAYVGEDQHWWVRQDQATQRIDERLPAGESWPVDQRGLAAILMRAQNASGTSISGIAPDRITGYAGRSGLYHRRSEGEKFDAHIWAGLGYGLVAWLPRADARDGTYLDTRVPVRFGVRHGLLGLVACEPTVLDPEGLIVFRCGGCIMVMDPIARKAGRLVRGDSMTVEGVCYSQE
jgi:hypothetical protein